MAVLKAVPEREEVYSNVKHDAISHCPHPHETVGL